MSSRARNILMAFLVSMTSVAAYANQAVNSSSTLYQRPKKETSIWSGFLHSSRTTGLYDFKDGSRNDSMDYSLRVNASLTPQYFLRMDTGYSQNMKDQELSDFADTSLTLRRIPMKLGRNFIFSYNVGGTAPTSEDSSKRANLKGSVRSGVILAINPSRLIPGLAFTSSASIAKNFHAYETDVTGKVLNEYSSTQSLIASYSFPVGITLSADVTHAVARSYQGTIQNSYLISQDISYGINETFQVSAGHSNSGMALKPNGQDYSIDMYNENTSTVYAALTVIF